VVAISGVVQNPNLYSVVGTTLTFSPAPPSGTSNIAVLYLGLPVIGSSSPGNTAFLSATDLTATASQTVFASAGSYTPGFVQVYRNGARLGNADFTATNGTTITLASAATAGDLVTIEYYTLTSLTNALPLTGGTVTGSTTFNSAVTINGAAVSGFTGMKNRIINGAQNINQRGASVTSAATYVTDRWQWDSNTTTATLTFAQSTVAPTGFTNSLGITVGTADTSIAAGDLIDFRHWIEGNNVADFGLGTASAVTFTVSFWVRSSIVGTYGASFRNSDASRVYVSTFTINVANTWEQKTITVAGDTSGTWLTDTGRGLGMNICLTGGSNYQTTAGVWTGAFNYRTTSAQANLAGTSGATFYITGVQLERGSNATSFEFIDYGRQLIQCQRYYQKFSATGSGQVFCSGMMNATTTARTFIPFLVPFRTNPSALEQSGTAGDYAIFHGATVTTCSAVPGFVAASVNGATFETTIASGGTAGNGALVRAVTSSAYLGFSAEL
jgi:hypothetical protein